MQPIKIFRQFFQLEAASSILLLAMAILAMLLANSPLAYLQQQFIAPWVFWINEGFMTLFFLLVGLELKRSVLLEQSHLTHLLLPAMAAIGGMMVPALLYVWINLHNVVALKGWSIPVATDIAFAIGVLSLFGKRVPQGLKLFLLSIAIFDDVGAILIIAFFYSSPPSWAFAAAACILVLALFVLNRLKIISLIPYLFLGWCLWGCLLFTGIHATLAGVIVAFAIPGNQSKQASPLYSLEQYLHPWVAYLIMPLFALANAGINFSGLAWSHVMNGMVLGIIVGLFIGKQLGVFGVTWLMARWRWISLPAHTTWLMLYGVSILCGIGFTMSLFLGTLSFATDCLECSIQVRLGVMIGSIISGLIGAIVLLAALNRSKSVD